MLEIFVTTNECEYKQNIFLESSVKLNHFLEQGISGTDGDKVPVGWGIEKFGLLDHI